MFVVTESNRNIYKFTKFTKFTNFSFSSTSDENTAGVWGLSGSPKPTPLFETLSLSPDPKNRFPTYKDVKENSKKLFATSRTSNTCRFL